MFYLVWCEFDRCLKRCIHRVRCMGDLGIPISVFPATTFDSNIILITADEKNLWKNDNTPLLFILYMNDLPLHIHNDIDMFADDSTLHTSGPNIEEIQLSLQTDLNVITTWCTDNKMVINTSKTMLITTHVVPFDVHLTMRLYV